MVQCIDNCFIKKCTYSEYITQRLIYNATQPHKFALIPKIHKFIKETEEIVMQKIPNMSLADFYGENWRNIPYHIKLRIKEIIKLLFSKGYVYPDITGYNFIEVNDRLYIIDFQHVFIYNGDYKSLDKQQKKQVKFVKRFINDENVGWNPEFK